MKLHVPNSRNKNSVHDLILPDYVIFYIFIVNLGKNQPPTFTSQNLAGAKISCTKVFKPQNQCIICIPYF